MELIILCIDFHSSRPGHDLRYALSGDKMKELGWQANSNPMDQIRDVVKWTLQNDQWLL